MTLKWEKAPEDVMEAFGAALPDDALVQRRKMFGFPCAFVNGNMFAGVHQRDVVVRLPEERRAELLASGAARQFEPMPGRPMREYLVVPDADLEDQAALGRWLDEAFRFTATMPAKEAKPRARKATTERSA
jgi:TfoX/Sxy family transcriptional regulator of competence genes